MNVFIKVLLLYCLHYSRKVEWLPYGKFGKDRMQVFL